MAARACGIRYYKAILDMENSMIIIGAGIAGLSTGCYAQMNGYKTAVLEMHTIPGDRDWSIMFDSPA